MQYTYAMCPRHVHIPPQKTAAQLVDLTKQVSHAAAARLHAAEQTVRAARVHMAQRAHTRPGTLHSRMPRPQTKNAGVSRQQLTEAVQLQAEAEQQAARAKQGLLQATAEHAAREQATLAVGAQIRAAKQATAQVMVSVQQGRHSIATQEASTQQLQRLTGMLQHTALRAQVSDAEAQAAEAQRAAAQAAEAARHAEAQLRDARQQQVEEQDAQLAHTEAVAQLELLRQAAATLLLSESQRQTSGPDLDALLCKAADQCTDTPEYMQLEQACQALVAKQAQLQSVPASARPSADVQALQAAVQACAQRVAALQHIACGTRLECKSALSELWESLQTLHAGMQRAAVSEPASTPALGMPPSLHTATVAEASRSLDQAEAWVGRMAAAAEAWWGAKQAAATATAAASVAAARATASPALSVASMTGLAHARRPKATPMPRAAARRTSAGGSSPVQSLDFDLPATDDWAKPPAKRPAAKPLLRSVMAMPSPRFRPGTRKTSTAAAAAAARRSWDPSALSAADTEDELFA